MMKKFLPLVLLFGALSLTAQKNDVPDLSKKDYIIVNNLEGDTIRYREKAYQILKDLKKGSVIVKLNTNPRSVNAYRQSGREDIARKIEEDRKLQNKKMYEAFIDRFNFCRVYFIYSADTKKFMAGQRDIFLGPDLQYDRTIVFTDTNYVFCQFGSPESYSKFTDQSGMAIPRPGLEGGNYERADGSIILDTTTRKTTTDPMGTPVLFFTDKDLEQLYRPFPMSGSLFFNNFDGAVTSINNLMHKAYFNLVSVRQMKDKEKEMRKQQKAAMRKSLK